MYIRKSPDAFLASRLGLSETKTCEPTRRLSRSLNGFLLANSPFGNIWPRSLLAAGGGGESGGCGCGGLRASIFGSAAGSESFLSFPSVRPFLRFSPLLLGRSVGRSHNVGSELDRMLNGSSRCRRKASKQGKRDRGGGEQNRHNSSRV
jgi:hypothetical protein